MNIFYLSHKPSRCARWHCDKHVVKMILETAQLLYTAHWALSIGPPKLLAAAPTLASNPHQHGYLPIKNAKHPCAIWTRASLEHYMWLCALGMALCEEFQHRYGGSHACEEHIYWLHGNPPPALKKRHGWSQPPQAMPDEYKRPGDSVKAYRAYYKENKGAVRGILQYSKRHRPHWL